MAIYMSKARGCGRGLQFTQDAIWKQMSSLCHCPVGTIKRNTKNLVMIQYQGKEALQGEEAFHLKADERRDGC